MRRKRKPKLAPQVPATPLESLEAISLLYSLTDEDLAAELKNATTVESWMRTFAVSHEGQDKDVQELAKVETNAAAYSRIAREVIKMIQFGRLDGGGRGGDGKGGPNGKPGPKGGGYL